MRARYVYVYVGVEMAKVCRVRFGGRVNRGGRVGRHLARLAVSYSFPCTPEKAE